MGIPSLLAADTAAQNLSIFDPASPPAESIRSLSVLVFAINRRSFGWTMPVDVQPTMLLQGLALAVGAALLAGLYPARRMARALAAEALRDE